MTTGVSSAGHVTAGQSSRLLYPMGYCSIVKLSTAILLSPWACYFPRVRLSFSPELLQCLCFLPHRPREYSLRRYKMSASLAFTRRVWNSFLEQKGHDFTSFGHLNVLSSPRPGVVLSNMQVKPHQGVFPRVALVKLFANHTWGLYSQQARRESSKVPSWLASSDRTFRFQPHSHCTAV